MKIKKINACICVDNDNSMKLARKSGFVSSGETKNEIFHGVEYLHEILVLDCSVNNTHTNKAINYDIGRPDYPDEFFDYLFQKIHLNSTFVIADIGAGTGKITKRFLEKGITVFALEPDNGMMDVLKKKLGQFSNCISILNSAENTKIPENSADLIFCGNSYHWFDRKLVIPEMKRIVKNNNSRFNIIIASLGPCTCSYTDEYLEIEKRFSKAVSNRVQNTSAPFQKDTFIMETFEYTILQGFTEFLNGSLSASYSPSPSDENYEEYCRSLKNLFQNYCKNDRIESKFKLSCIIGNTEHLVY